MLTTIPGAKGGQGCTTVTAGLALVSAPVVAVDAGGDLPAVLGVREPAGPGVVDLLLSDVPVTVEALARWLLDAGTGPAWQTATAAGARSVLVVRNCYLALRRAVQHLLHPDGVVLVAEPGHALDVRDIETVMVGVPVTTVRVDPGVGRAVDAGLLAVRLPRSLRSDLASVAT